MKIKLIKRKKILSYEERILKDIIASSQELGHLTLNAINDINEKNIPYLEEVLAGIRNRMYLNARFGNTGIEINTNIFEKFKSIDGFKFNDSDISAGKFWILQKIEDKGFEIIINENHLGEEVFEIHWGLSYPLKHWLQTPRGKKYIALFMFLLLICVWLNCKCYLHPSLRYLSVIDETVIAIIVAMWLGLRLDSYTEQRAKFNLAYKK